MEGEPRTLAKPVLVLGEGDDEANFVEALAGAHDLEDAQPGKHDGRDNLFGVLGALQSRFSSLRALVILCDADADPGAAFESACSALRRRGLACVRKHRKGGVEEPSKARIRAWLSTRRRAECRVGLAAKLGSFPLTSDVFRPLVEFLNRA
jgi:hypothetical protein